MGETHKKGKALEYAVRRIEETILARDPSFKGANARIEQNKILVINGVRHDLDVWVTLHPGTGYESTHLIECKN